MSSSRITSSGNPYDHSEHWREDIDNRAGTMDCAWCGQKPARLHRYGEGRTPNPPKGPMFCTRSCARSYWG